jgi:hypothetical protein
MDISWSARHFQVFSMRTIDFSHENTPESFWRKNFLEQFSPKNDQMAVFLEHPVVSKFKIFPIVYIGYTIYFFINRVIYFFCFSSSNFA